MVHDCTLVYGPSLHRDFVPAALCALKTVWPGLPVPGTRRGGAAPWNAVEWYIPKTLPFTPSQAASCLDTLSALDEASLAAFSESATDRQADMHKASLERQDLARFVAGAEEVERPAAQDWLVSWAQHYLLLGWLQEGHVLELTALSSRYRASAERLSHQLSALLPGDDDDAKELRALIQESDSVAATGMGEAFLGLAPEDTRVLLPSWKFMFELLSCLLEPEIVLCTADSAMLREARQVGILLKEPQPALRSLLPAEGTVLCGTAPVWKWLGRSSLPERPWLDQERTVCFWQEEGVHDC